MTIYLLIFIRLLIFIVFLKGHETICQQLLHFVAIIFSLSFLTASLNPIRTQGNGSPNQSCLPFKHFSS